MPRFKSKTVSLLQRPFKTAAWTRLSLRVKPFLRAETATWIQKWFGIFVGASKKL
jgi:hypothetical protein